MANIQLDLSRQSELFDAHKFTEKVTVIGAGATASWLVTALARLGITDITVWDFDVIEEHNVPNQAFGIHQVGMLKVDALKENVLRETGLEISTVAEPYVDQKLFGYVFCMVDSMDTRQAIWKNAVRLKPQVKLFVEPRMGLEVGRVYNVEPMKMAQIKGYEDTFYSDAEAEVSACGTSMTVVTTAMNIASACARQLISHHVDGVFDNEILYDFKYNNIITNQWT